ncbi:hypothetical protein DM480_08180 [Sphingomonas sp. FARSPH]|jgi:hypothetical protein|nr:hypothetical protein DM480_08180 [Sphingomonas sp. FARSPH]
MIRRYPALARDPKTWTVQLAAPRPNLDDAPGAMSDRGESVTEPGDAARRRRRRKKRPLYASAMRIIGIALELQRTPGLIALP